MSYSSLSAAKKGAVRKGLDLNEINFYKDKDLRWYWEDKKLQSPEAETTVEQVQQLVEEPVITPAAEASEIAQQVAQQLIKEVSNKGKGLKIEKGRDEKNGILRPSVGGKCRAIWDACDEFRARTRRIPMPKEMKEIAEEKGWNPNNAVIEMYQWRKFEGLIGRKK